MVARLVAGLGRPLVKYLSDLARESLKQPGSWRCLEIVYRNEPGKLLDYLFLSSRAARGARNRLEILKTELCSIVRERTCIEPSRPTKLVSFGSGPGHEILGCLERLGPDVVVTATCVDCDEGAISHGAALAARMGLDGRVQYILGNILRMNDLPAGYDVAVLSGLLDYFDSDTSVSVLRKVRGGLNPGGVVLVANMRRHRLASTMRSFGDWDLVYREPKEVETLLARSGYDEIEVTLESEQVFCLGKGRHRSQAL